MGGAVSALPGRRFVGPDVRAPEGLGNRGRSLWKQIHKAVATGFELDERELVVLVLACRQADDVARLEAAIRTDGAMTRGSAGQPVLHPAISEVRQARQAISRLLGAIELPTGEDEVPRTEASRRAQHAAQARWAQVAERHGRGPRDVSA